MQHALATRAGELKRSDVAAAGYAKGVFADGAEADVLDNCVAIVHQIESMVAFILSARGVGYLPEHVARPWIEGGHMKIVLPDAFNSVIPVYLAVRRKSLESPLVRRLVDLFLEQHQHASDCC